MEQSDLATVSRAGFESWRNTRNGTQGGATRDRPTRTNWWHPFLWPAIDDAMRRADWSPEACVRILHRDHPQLYSHLHRGTVWKWKKPNERAWSEKTVEKVQKRHALLGSGRAGVLTKFPDLVEKIKETLLGLRTSGLLVNTTIGRSLMLNLIRTHHPEVLTPKFQFCPLHRCLSSPHKRTFQIICLQ
ncbi:hypothetical protein EV361DRAFT_973635 [Lentinula raphanica]|nr:hypothetical protein EV361DRAFT_973635 [Lentinula raphanica]